MKILAVIVTYRAMPWIDRCLGSLQASGHPVDMMVVDNGSDDGTPAHIREHFPQVLLQETGENLGFGRANNIGLRYALEKGYDAVYLMNQDAWVEEGTIGALSEAAAAHPEMGILSPLQRNVGGAYDGNFARKCVEATSLEADRKAGTLKVVYPVRFVMAAHWLLTRRCLEAAGLFAPVFPLYGEDDNYCQRVLFHGFGIGIVPSANAIHDRSERVEPQEKIIYRNYRMAALVMFCDIRHPLFRQRLKVFGYTLVKILRYRSLLPWRHYCELRKAMPKIRDTRAETARRGAFISES